METCPKSLTSFWGLRSCTCTRSRSEFFVFQVLLMFVGMVVHKRIDNGKKMETSDVLIG